MAKKAKVVLSSFIVLFMVVISFVGCSVDDIGYKVTFDIGDDDIYHSFFTFGNEEVVLPPSPYRIGFKFEGWFLDNYTWRNAFAEDSLLGVELSEGLSVFAKWEYDFIEGVPVVLINTIGNKPVVLKEEYISAIISILNVPSEFCFEHLSADVRGRGNFSWDLEKKPYRIKLDKKQSMFGSDYTAKSWTLIANHSDKTLIRNKLAYDFSRTLDTLIYSPMAQLVEVFFNGEYIGVYLFSDHNQINAGRVDLPEAKTGYEQLDNIGFFLELSRTIRFDAKDENSLYFRIDDKDTCVKFRSPDPDDLDNMFVYINYIKPIIENVDEAILSNDYALFSQYIDVPSFIDYFLIQELFRNIDAGVYSTHFYKRPNDIKLYMGPVWDFDLCAGNDFYTNIATDDCYIQNNEDGKWFGLLMQNEQFFQQYVARWNQLYSVEIKALVDSINMNYLDENYLRACKRNFERWQIMGKYVWPNPAGVVEIDTYEGQIEYLYTFLKERAEWLNSHYNS